MLMACVGWSTAFKWWLGVTTQNALLSEIQMITCVFENQHAVLRFIIIFLHLYYFYC